MVIKIDFTPLSLDTLQTAKFFPLKRVLKNKYLKGGDEWGNVYINPDPSPIERKEIKKLVAEMKTKIVSDPPLCLLENIKIETCIV